MAAAGGNASAYYQGQYLTSLYNWVEPDGELIIPRETKEEWFVIKRETEYDPTSQLQVIDCEWTLPPQSRLIQQEGASIILNAKCQMNEPIMIQEPEYIDSGTAGKAIVLSDLSNPTMNMENIKAFYNLWSRYLDATKVVRYQANDAARAVIRISQNNSANLSFRQNTWLLAFETLLNYHPSKFMGSTILLTLQTEVNIMICQQNIVPWAQALGIAPGTDLYSQLLKPFETEMMTSLPSLQMHQKIAQHVLRYMQEKPTMFLDRSQCLILWLTMPHPTVGTQVDRTWHFVMFNLAYFVRNNRTPANSEFDSYWLAQQNSAVVDGQFGSDISSSMTSVGLQAGLGHQSKFVKLLQWFGGGVDALQKALKVPGVREMAVAAVGEDLVKEFQQSNIGAYAQGAAETLDTLDQTLKTQKVYEYEDEAKARQGAHAPRKTPLESVFAAITGDWY